MKMPKKTMLGKYRVWQALNAFPYLAECSNTYAINGYEQTQFRQAYQAGLFGRFIHNHHANEWWCLGFTKGMNQRRLTNLITGKQS